MTISSGRDEVIGQLPHRLDELEQNVFTLRSYASGSTSPEPPFDDTFWDGPARHTLTLQGDLAAWSYDSVGWLAETLAELAARLGARAPLLLTATRSDQPRLP
ncbi:hypothetical protein [Streptomyces roseirectus]|uniref:hypothetical protein n=1 Tax=Streptomyces roseirectus TaxID=2768066 RepID=UPI001FE25E7C|nr:hypothetical protein [Streptomyces roseirectus]